MLLLLQQVTIKLNKVKENLSLATGFIQKKIVLTTRRCLMYQSLANKTQQIEYQVIARKKVPGKDDKQQVIKQPKKSRISINQYPEYWFNANQRDVKVVIDQQPSLIAYFQKSGVKNLVKRTTGMVLLKNSKKQKFQCILFPALKQAFRFAKGLICAKAWLVYQSHCAKSKIQQNHLWIRILQQIVTHQNSLTLIDPDLFDTGAVQQMKAFFVLIMNIQFAHSFQFRFSIVNQESVLYTVDFLKNLQQKIHSINLSKTNLDSDNLIKIVSMNLKMKNLMKLNLENNALTDRCFNALQALTKQSKKLSYINLSYNQITLLNFSTLLEFLKATPIILNLNISQNKISDKAAEHIQKFILFALNPPIQQFDISFNEFSQKTAWRLYLGFLKNFKNHVYLNFLVYPIPFKKQIFSEMQIDFPRKQKQVNFNMHSALISEFQQESMMKHSMADILVPQQTVTIKFIRQLLPNVRLPKNKQQVSKTLVLSNKIQNFVYSTQSVQKIYELAVEIKSFPFQVPPRTRNNFISYLNKKLNEALLIRDHYSIKYILKSMKELQIPFQGYTQRLQRVQLRDKILCKRLQNILQFKHHQMTINKEIDELVKQSLRLYIEGRGAQLLYYIKFLRDQYVQKLLFMGKYNPEHELYGKMASKNLSIQERVTSRDFIIPYEIKIQKKINQNFYLHPWQTNYLILSEMTTKAFVQCLQFLQESQKRQTFAKYFERIEERVQFIKNQFTLFTYKQFKVTYTDLKVNACRLLFLYKNIQDTHFFLQIPIYIKKRPITNEKKIVIHNPDLFLKKYHIVNYPNINYQAKKNNFYNYPNIITRYQSETFQSQVRKILNILNSNIFKVMEQCIHSRKPKTEMIDKIILPIKQIMDIVRHSIYPEQIKEELYLHLMGWRKGKHGKNIEVIELISWLTMYLKPPIQIQKYLVASVLQCKKQQIQKFPLCVVSQVNKPTPEDILKQDAQFVERDWMPPDYIIPELIMNNGKLSVEIQLLDKKKIQMQIAESTNISQLMSYLLGFHQLSCQDRECFWIYKLDKQTQQTTPLTGSDYLGEIVTNLVSQAQILICRRRLYCRQIKYVYTRYGQAIINSLYSQIKFDYMMRGLFDSDKNIFQITSLLFIIDNLENFQILQKKDPLFKAKTIEQFIGDQSNRIQSIYPAYIPRQIMARIMKDKQTTFTQIKAKISERMLKNQHLAIYDMKTQFIRYFELFPQFCSTNYKMFDKNSTELKVFINCMYLYIQSQTEKQYIKLQKIISIIPKAKYMLISYHKHENIIGQIPLFSQQVNILAVSMDILSYCLMRLKMVSNNLYQINKYQRIEWENDEIQRSLKRIYDKSLEQKLIKNRLERQNINAKIMKMSLTLMDLKQLIYYSQSKYIKSFLDRKLYANKSQKKMGFSMEMDQEQARQTEIWNKNLFQSIFPQHQEKPPELYDPQNDDFNEDSEYDVDFYTQPQVIKKQKIKQISPSKPTEKKVDPRQNLNQQPDQQNMATSKKVPPLNQTRPESFGQPSNQPQMNNTRSNKQIEPISIPKQQELKQPKKPVQTLQKQKLGQINPKPVEANEPTIKKPPIQDQKPNQDDDAVIMKKQGGGRVPPRRRQR